jgi:hypothetical protein
LKSGVPNTSRAQIICVQVVPLFSGVLITTSPSRNAKPSQRALSWNNDRYRTTGPSLSARQPSIHAAVTIA